MNKIFTAFHGEAVQACPSISGGQLTPRQHNLDANKTHSKPRQRNPFLFLIISLLLVFLFSLSLFPLSAFAANTGYKFNVTSGWDFTPAADSKANLSFDAKQGSTIFDLAIPSSFDKSTPPSPTATTADETMGTAAFAATDKENEYTLTATPLSGYRFDYWSVGDTIVSGANPYTVTLTENKAFTAHFVEESAAYKYIFTSDNAEKFSALTYSTSGVVNGTAVDSTKINHLLCVNATNSSNSKDIIAFEIDGVRTTKGSLTSTASQVLTGSAITNGTVTAKVGKNGFGEKLYIYFASITASKNIEVKFCFNQTDTIAFTPTTTVTPTDTEKGTIASDGLTFVENATDKSYSKWKLTTTPASGYRLSHIQAGDDEATRINSTDGKTITWDVTADTAYTAYFARASLALGDTVFSAPTGSATSNVGALTSKNAAPISVGQRVRISVPYSYLGNANISPTTSNSELKIYAGEGTDGTLLYDGALVENFVLDPMPNITKLTISAKILDNEPTVKTYDITVKPSGRLDLSYPELDGNGYGATAFVDENTGVLSVYYATSSGVYYEDIKGLTALTGTTGAAIAVGGKTKDKLYAVTTTYDYANNAYQQTYHLYSYANATKEWILADESHSIPIQTDTNTAQQAVLIMDANSIWLSDVHWDGDSWEPNAVTFNSFWKDDADTAYAGSANGVYRYEDGAWTPVSGTSGTMYITSGCRNADGVTFVTAEKRTTAIDFLSGSNNYYNEKTGGAIHKVTIADGSASVSDVDVSTIPAGNKQISSYFEFVGIAADGEIYAVTSGRSYAVNDFLSYDGTYIYKLTGNEWVNQNVDAFNNAKDKENIADGKILGDGTTLKLRPDYVRSFTSPCAGVTLFLGYNGGNYSLYGKTTISFDSQEGSEVSPVSQTIGTAVTAPDSPEMEGYTFAGWYTKASCLDKYLYSFGVMPAKDITLYAKWTSGSDSLDAIKAAAITSLDGEYANTRRATIPQTGGMP